MTPPVLWPLAGLFFISHTGEALYVFETFTLILRSRIISTFPRLDTEKTLANYNIDSRVG